MEAPPLTPLLLLLSRLSQSGRISLTDRGKLKDLVLAGDARVYAAFRVFEQTSDEDDLIETWLKIIGNNPNSSQHSQSIPSSNTAPLTPRYERIDSLFWLAQQRWFPFYKYVKQEQESLDAREALARIEKRVRGEIGRLLFTVESRSLESSSEGLAGTDTNEEDDDVLAKDLNSLSIQELCIKYGGQGIVVRITFSSSSSASFLFFQYTKLYSC